MVSIERVRIVRAHRLDTVVSTIGHDYAGLFAVGSRDWGTQTACGSGRGPCSWRRSSSTSSTGPSVRNSLR